MVNICYCANSSDSSLGLTAQSQCESINAEQQLPLMHSLKEVKPITDSTSKRSPCQAAQQAKISSDIDNLEAILTDMGWRDYSTYNAATTSEVKDRQNDVDAELEAAIGTQMAQLG